MLLDGLRPVLIGLLIGLSGGVAVGSAIRSILYDTSPADPVVFASMVGMLVTGMAACALPAIRASRIEPMKALRTE